MAVNLTRILFPMMICTGLAYSFVGILQSLGEFHIPALISLVSNTIMVLYLVLVRDRLGVTGIAVAMLCGWAAQMLVQIPKLRSFGFRLTPSAGVMSPHIRRSLRLALPILIATWTAPVCTLVNTRFASALEEGRAITALGYANRLYTIIVGVFSFVATNLLFPYFSRAAAAGDLRHSRRMMMTSIRTLTFIIAPIAVGAAVLAEPLTALLYQKGAFTAADTALTAEALRFYAVGMLFMAANEVLTKAFFAENRPKIPMVTSLITMVVNILLVAALSRFGIGGIALASGLSSGVQCLCNALFMRRLSEEKLPVRDVSDLIKSVFSALAMGAALHLLRPMLPGGSVTHVLSSVGIGAAVYALLVILFRSEEAVFVLSKLRRGAMKDEGN